MSDWAEPCGSIADCHAPTGRSTSSQWVVMFSVWVALPRAQNCVCTGTELSQHLLSDLHDGNCKQLSESDCPRQSVLIFLQCTFSNTSSYLRRLHKARGRHDLGNANSSPRPLHARKQRNNKVNYEIRALFAAQSYSCNDILGALHFART